MPDHQVDLPSAIHLISSMRFVEKLAERRARYPFLPDVEGIRSDLSEMAHRGPVPARVKSGQADRSAFLEIYIDGRYVLALYARERGNGYSVSNAYPMNFGHHDDIVRGALLIQAPAWIYHDRIQELPFDADAHWDLLQERWRLLNRGGTAPRTAEPTTPKAHEEFLDALDAVIESGRRVELAAARTEGMISYRRVEASAARRRSARSVHDFLLTGSHRPLVGTRLHVRGAPDLRGRVDLLRGTLMTVRFERPVDLDAIPRVGAFTESPSTIPFDRQAEAVRMLRDGHSANPHLLDVLAAHRFRPFTPYAAEPARALDDSQRSAFRKALAVPDVGLILGPPGTGKTRTITEIARASAARGERVLVTSYTNRAVDNVLQELPTDLVVLRVGREDGVTPGCEHLTLEEQAATLQGEILRRTETAFRSYASAEADQGEAAGWLRQLDASIHALHEAEVDQQEVSAALRRRSDELTAPMDERARDLSAAAEEHRRELADHGACLAALADRRERAEARARWPLIGPLLRGRANRLADEHRRGQLHREHLEATLDSVLQDRAAAIEEARRIRESSPELSKLRSALDDATTEAHRRALAAAADAEELRALIYGVPVPDQPGPGLPELDTFLELAARALAVMRRRLGLLAEWRGHLGSRTEQLYPELIRYADVIGATCIGAATTTALKGLDFALAIVDEAGQISTPNVLVPLVRARRAVLVGDHNQLPPFVDEQVERWARHDPRAHGLVTKSAFELLFPGVPEGHREILRYQRRMPPVVARFVSRQFYNGFLESDVDRPHRDALFDSPLVFVDTAGLPQRRRHERRPRPDERWADTGYANDAEAEVITDLVGHYDGRVADWAVILPYQAQVGLVTEMLAGRIADEERAAAGVGTVDSFQGGERDLIVFGFTRSNARGAIGFLDELRRANVAFSRPRRLLILVGDSTTLMRAADPGFRSMAEALLRHVHHNGDSRDVREIRPLIARQEA
ncbi:AAA domain-containing protein [Actinomadura meyerae]|uniref:AAA domain-containing protein n=1 Tax=Actinomadura meyerae TaxID=240840 RepID=A0A239EIJ0_9ACTN|nr:AAA domain-containing protein [Actinomadura meyerae]SNS44379.1 AAA domain-containing protein [Actinomadura meyerae]